MDELIAKTTNLGYEILGVIVPGLIFLLFLLIAWVSAGPIIDIAFFGKIPQLHLSDIEATIKEKGSDIGFLALLLVSAYFLGHILLWISRSRNADETITKNAWKRIWFSLLFKIPRPSISYDKNLDNLYQAVMKQFDETGCGLTWRQFFPVAKSYLSRNLTHSLVSTYQNKYTLHRSITAAAAVLFWLSTAILSTGAALCFYKGISPHWWLLIPTIIASIVVIWGFSSSYAYHWLMFGNTIITESYSLLFGSKYDKPKQ